MRLMASSVRPCAPAGRGSEERLDAVAPHRAPRHTAAPPRPGDAAFAAGSPARWPRRPSAPAAPTVPPLPDLVGLQVELEVQPWVERSVLPLRPVLEVHLGELQADGLGVWLVLGAGVADGDDRHVVKPDDEVILLPFARLAVGDRRVLDVQAGRTRRQELWGGLVYTVDDRQILECRLSGAAASAGGGRPGIRDTPGEREHLDLVLVLGVKRFAFDVPDLRGSHWRPSPAAIGKILETAGAPGRVIQHNSATPASTSASASSPGRGPATAVCAASTPAERPDVDNVAVQRNSRRTLNENVVFR